VGITPGRCQTVIKGWTPTYPHISAHHTVVIPTLVTVQHGKGNEDLPINMKI